MTAPVVERFWAKVNKRGVKKKHMTTRCWTWTGKPSEDGYGSIMLDRRSGSMKAHRFSYLLHYGEFDRSSLVLHHCDTPSCVRPTHIYLGDNAQNTRDKMERGRHPNVNKTHCKSGHPLAGDNLYQYGSKRKCKACNFKRTAEYRARLKEARGPKAKRTNNTGSRNPNARLHEDDVREIRRRLSTGEDRGAIAKDYGVGRQQVRQIAKGISWGWLDAEDGVA